MSEKAQVRVYVDRQGNLLGGWDDPANAPEGAVAVDTWPEYASQKWTGSGWTAHVPPPAPPTPLDWFLRLSTQTQAALDTAARTDTAVSLALRYASGVSVVDVADPRTITNVNLLRSKGLLSDAEVALLLAP